jgi:hypothetical protein
MSAKPLNTEAEESMALEAVTRQPVKKPYCEVFIPAIMSCRVCKLSLALELFAVTIFKSPINPITNPTTCIDIKSSENIYTTRSSIKN